MRRFLLLAACVLLLPGCLATFGLQVGNTGVPSTQPSVGPGGSFSSSSVNARFSDAPAYGSILGVGILGVLFGEERRKGAQRTPPELDASRPVHEQDCSKALENASANLRCR